MKLLQHAILQDHYDVVVIGAGIGGITAGAMLAHKGLSTLVVDQHYLPGGVCTTVKRDGVAMDAGAALLFGFSPGTDSPHTYVMNTLDQEIDMIPHDALYRMHFQGGRSVTFWKDFERYFAELVTAFPGRDAQFRGFYDECFDIFNAMNANPMPMSPDTMPRAAGLKMALRHPFRTRRLLKSMDTSLASVLDRYVQDPEVMGFFDLLIASCYCTKAEETPLMLGTAIVCNTHGQNGGACYPAGSPQMLPNKLELALERLGGQVLYRHRVERILVRDGRARGVRLDDGSEVAADHVISDADVYQLYGKLLPPEAVSDEKRRWVQSLVPSVSAVVLYIGLDAAAIPEGTRNIEALIDDLEVLDKNNCFAYIPSIDDPSVAPEGMHSMSVLCSAGDWDWPRPDDPRYQGPEYQRRKQEIADRALDALEARLFPDLRKHIRCMEIGTPSTVERFTLKSWGNIGGPKQMLGQHLFRRLKARTEIDRLYAVGDSTVMGEGVVSVTASAVGAANMVLEDRGMKPFLARRFDRERVRYVEGQPRGPMPVKGEELTAETARRLALECQWCEHPHCMEDCPAGVDVPGFVRRIEAGNHVGAARLIRESNPLAELCGEACPSSQLCEARCDRLRWSDGPVRIAELQAWASREAGAEGWPTEEPTRREATVAVVGAGPAGLSCAWFLARLGYGVKVLDPRSAPGGVPGAAIPDFRVGDDVLARDLAGILSRPEIQFQGERSLGDELSVADLLGEHGAVFLAAGRGQGRRLEIDGLPEEQIVDALGLLEAAKRGDGPCLHGHVVVIGGGSVAADAACMAKGLGAGRVSLVCLEALDEMPCLPKEREEMRRLEVEVHAGLAAVGTGPEGLRLCSCSSVLDAQGRFAPVLDETRTGSLDFDQVVMAVGQEVEPALRTALTRDLGRDYVLVDPATQLISGQERVFAGGDLVRGASTIVEAVADGRRAAAAIHEQLSGRA
jgi:phytoene desaturase